MNFTKLIAIGALCLASAQAYAGNAVVRIYNNSGVTIWELYTSPTWATRYGQRDILGNSTISNGSSKLLDFDVPDAENQCTQELLAVGKDGRRWNWRMDVCRESSWTLNP